MTVRTLTLAVLALVLSAGTAVGDAGSLNERLAGTFTVPGIVAATSTAMVVDLRSEQVIFERNADLSLQPASNQKLAVTYAAVVELGASYRFPTQVLGEGRRIGDTWHGRLILKGYGDPTLTSADLRRLTGILWRMGIRRVTGGIGGDASYFDSKRDASGWLSSFAGAQCAPLSALVVDRAARNGFLVRDPALAAAARFDQLLRVRGIVARGASTRKATRHATLLATINSEPLSDVLHYMDHYSDNFTAEMVLKAIGARATGHGTTVAGGAVTKRALRAAGVPVAGVRIADGSGLSRDDRVTARELMSLLVTMWKDPVLRPIVWDSLPVAGETGTLAHRLLDHPRHHLLRAKTGTTDIASALAGFVGRRYAFVAIENGRPVDYWAAHAAEDGVVTALLDQIALR